MASLFSIVMDNSVTAGTPANEVLSVSDWLGINIDWKMVGIYSGAAVALAVLVPITKALLVAELEQHKSARRCTRRIAKYTARHLEGKMGKRQLEVRIAGERILLKMAKRYYSAEFRQSVADVFQALGGFLKAVTPF